MIFILQHYLILMDLPCLNNNYTTYMAMFKNTTQDPTGKAVYRQWIYQTCTQFGYCRFNVCIVVCMPIVFVYLSTGTFD